MDEMQVSELVERLSVAAGALESAVERLTAEQETVGRIVATVESAREAELERKLAEAEAMIAELRAAGAASEASGSAGGRKTAVALMAKGLGEGVGDVAALDAALVSLSVEQRIAVKAEMLRSGLLR